MLNLLVLAVLIYGGVKIFFTLAGSKLTSVRTEDIKTQFRGAAPEEKGRPAFDYYAAAAKRELFGPVKEPADKSKELTAEDLEPAELNIELLGTVSGDLDNAVAIISETRKKEQSLYKEGDSIEDATIVKILRGKVILRVGDENQILSMEEKPRTSGPPSGREVPGPSGPTARPESATGITLDRAVVTESLQNINEILSQVRVRPHYRDGKADGLMLSQIKPNTIFTKMRLRNGDVVQRVNGKPITSPDDIMGFYEELKSGESVSLDIRRRGRDTTLNYTFK